MHRVRGILLVVAGLCLVLAGCGKSPGATSAAGKSPETLNISAIPDQDPQVLQRQYDALTGYLSRTLGVKVRYVPVTDYTATITGFRTGDLDLVFFGGLTGVQARLQVPGAVPLVQRDIDAQFRSVFIATARAGVQPFTDVSGLAAVAGRTLTFGSESSTSGRLMPQHFLEQVGVGLNRLKGQPGFSGSHDATIKLVESGAFDVGAVNAAVWDDRTKNGKVDQTKVREVFRTPPFHDYHWLIRPDVDKRLGSGFTQRATQAFLDIDGGDDQEKQLLTLFQCKGFTATEAANYQQIESVGRSVGLIK